jgi:hypothetical protein
MTAFEIRRRSVLCLTWGAKPPFGKRFFDGGYRPQ